MSYEDDEYWDSEYDDERPAPYTDATATARDPYAEAAVLSRWGPDTRRPPEPRKPPRAQYIEEDDFDDSPRNSRTSERSAPRPAEPAVDELAERRQRRQADQRSPKRDEQIKQAFDGDRPSWLDDPGFEAADLDVAPVSPGVEGWQMRSLDFDELEYDDRDFDASDWEAQRRYVSAQRARRIETSSFWDGDQEEEDQARPRRSRRKPAEPTISGRARVTPPEADEDRYQPSHDGRGQRPDDGYGLPRDGQVPGRDTDPRIGQVPGRDTDPRLVPGRDADRSGEAARFGDAEWPDNVEQRGVGRPADERWDARPAADERDRKSVV